jgi:aminoglycoside 6'-N-acetyltransferase I
MEIQQARSDDLEAWVALRHALWPTYQLEDLRAEAHGILASDDEVCFLAIEDDERIVGFVEGAVHPGPGGPYGHVEGWFLVPEFRQRGHGRRLVGELEHWCLHRAIYLLTSDTTSSYPISPAAHAGCGLRQIHEFKIFLKQLRQPPLPGER